MDDLIFIWLFQDTLIYKGSIQFNLHLVEQKIITQILTKSNFHKGAASIWITLCSLGDNCRLFSGFFVTLLSKFSAFAIFFPILSSHFSLTCVLKSSASCRGYIKHLSASHVVDLLLPKPPFACLHPRHQTTAICTQRSQICSHRAGAQEQSRS